MYNEKTDSNYEYVIVMSKNGYLTAFNSKSFQGYNPETHKIGDYVYDGKVWYSSNGFKPLNDTMIEMELDFAPIYHNKRFYMVENLMYSPTDSNSKTLFFSYGYRLGFAMRSNGTSYLTKSNIERLNKIAPGFTDGYFKTSKFKRIMNVLTNKDFDIEPRVISLQDL